MRPIRLTSGHCGSLQKTHKTVTCPKELAQSKAGLQFAANEFWRHAATSSRKAAMRPIRLTSGHRGSLQKTHKTVTCPKDLLAQSKAGLQFAANEFWRHAATSSRKAAMRPIRLTSGHCGSLQNTHKTVTCPKELAQSKAGLQFAANEFWRHAATSSRKASMRPIRLTSGHRGSLQKTHKTVTCPKELAQSKAGLQFAANEFWRHAATSSRKAAMRPIRLTSGHRGSLQKLACMLGTS